MRVSRSQEFWVTGFCRGEKGGGRQAERNDKLNPKPQTLNPNIPEKGTEREREGLWGGGEGGLAGFREGEGWGDSIRMGVPENGPWVPYLTYPTVEL